MTDCSNIEMREQLPELVSGELSSADAQRVESHLVSCAECQHELAILRAVRAMRAQPVAIDIARVVASLPSATPTRPDVISIRKPKVLNLSAWRMAAGIGAIAVGGLSWQIARNAGVAPMPYGDTTEAVSSIADSGASNRRGSPAGAENSAHQVAVSFGDLGDYSDEELQVILEKLEKWDGEASAEPLPTLPLVALTKEKGK